MDALKVNFYTYTFYHRKSFGICRNWQHVAKFWIVDSINGSLFMIEYKQNQFVSVNNDSLPPSCQLVLFLPASSQASNIALNAQAANPPHEPFVKDLIKKPCGSLRRSHPRPWTVTLTKHVIVVKIEEVCNTRPILVKLLTRVEEVVCVQEIHHPALDEVLKEFSWDGGQAYGSEVTCFCEETPFIFHLFIFIGYWRVWAVLLIFWNRPWHLFAFSLFS